MLPAASAAPAAPVHRPEEPKLVGFEKGEVLMGG